MGKLEPSGDDKAQLMYNEFIVYNVDQIGIRYLVEMEFL
eukprot:CAMPEP_0114017546 /NCGR_PEP_ID=MMETSP0372-20130328/14707_1 /TAXON_ID=340204 /ORGANISM="Lankesteria abbotti" /LENGTH=38 /assembly_acc=CAM_ASM_000359